MEQVVPIVICKVENGVTITHEGKTWIALDEYNASGVVRDNFLHPLFYPPVNERADAAKEDGE